MRDDASPRSKAATAAVEGLQLVVETTSWVAAWLLLPVWLALGGATAADFLLHALGAGLLLSSAVVLDRPDGFGHPGDIAWFAAASVLAVLLVGGFVFAVTAALVG